MKRLKKILSKILEIEENSITDKTSVSNVSSWDSFNSLMVISEIESIFNIKLTMQEAVSMKSLKDIKNVLKKYGIIL